MKPRATLHSDRVAIGRCIAGCIRAKDGRGRAQNEMALRERLLPSTTTTIARLTAAAARAVGEVIARASAPRGNAAPNATNGGRHEALNAPTKTRTIDTEVLESESAHSLPTVGGGRLCSMGDGRPESGVSTPASLHNGREQTKPVSGLPDHSAPEPAPRKNGQPINEAAA